MRNPYQSVIDWLDRTPEGEEWSKRTHHVSGPATFLVTVKDDDWDMPSVILWMYQAEPSRIKEP